MAKRRLVTRICQCGMKFDTYENDKYCVECRKGIRAMLKAANYLTPRPYPTKIKPDNRGHHSDDPSPGDENAVRVLEDGQV